MPTDQRTDDIFRQYEKNVLDEHHKTFPLWNRDRPVAVYAALAQFDCSAIYALFMPDKMSGLGTTQIIKGTQEGFSQAIKWLHPGEPPYDPVPTDDRVIIGEAGDYCAFAAKYVDIADFHKMYGRGQIDVEVNNEERRVRFAPRPNKPPTSALLPLAEQVGKVRRLPIARDPESADKIATAVHRSMDSARYHYADGRIVLDDISIANSPCVRDSLALAIPPEPILLDRDADLSGFPVQELSDYFEALRRWSFCCTFLFMKSLLEHGKQQWECIPTQAVERKEFIASIHTLSGLSPDMIETITIRLTYDGRTGSPEVFQQPLFCGPSYVTWSVQTIQTSKYLRNMLKLMSRTKALQDYTATLIGGRERVMLRELGSLLSSNGGCSYKLLTPLETGGREGEVDLLAYNPRFPEEVLLIEAKAVLGVDEINEVDAATQQMIEGQSRLRRVEEILREMPDQQKGQLFKFVNWKAVTNYFGVVVAADAEPNNLYDHSVYPGISLQTVKVRLRNNHYASPQKFWLACKQRHWLHDLAQYQASHQRICVGDVTYDLPVRIKPRTHSQPSSEGTEDQSARRLGRKKRKQRRGKQRK